MANKTTLPFLTNPGAVLSDRDIKAAIKTGIINVKAPHKLSIQPASLDVHLGKNIMTIMRRRSKDAAIDLKKPIDEFVEYEVLDPKKGAVIHPHEFILGVTTEWFHLGSQIIANVDGKSSLGRLGLVIHATAGFVDPGFRGHITLEITNLTDMPLVLYPDMPVGQVRFTVLTSPAETSYGDPKLGSKKYPNDYSKNPKPIASQFWKNFTK